MDGIGKIEVTIEHGGKSESIKVDDGWLNKERKRIEDEYTYPIKNFGRVVLYTDRGNFDKATSRFKSIVEKYQEALRATLVSRQSEFEKRIIGEFSPRWKHNPPKHFERWQIEPTPENIASELQKLAQELFESAITFDPPAMRILYKNVAPENIRDERFPDELKRIMVKRRVPRAIIDRLFESGQAAPATGAFLDR